MAATTAATATKDVAKNITEDITKVGVTRVGLAFDPGVAVLVVTCALLLVRKYFERFVRFLEAVLGALVVGVTVRVILHGDLAVSLLDVGFRGITLYTQYFVKITLGHVDF